MLICSNNKLGCLWVYVLHRKHFASEGKNETRSWEGPQDPEGEYKTFFVQKQHFKTLLQQSS
jgi:hypothetical protein